MRARPRHLPFGCDRPGSANTARVADIRIPRGKETLAAQNAQRDESRRATFEELVKKRHLEREVPIKMPGDDGELVEVTLLFRALGAKEYDKLLSRNPPTTEQKANGASYNIDTFGPALISAVCLEPPMTASEVNQIWMSDDWNRGEVMSLFSAAVEICNKGLDIPFTGLD